MKKYRIVPQAPNYYWLETKSSILGSWMFCSSFHSLEEAKAYVEKQKRDDKQAEYRRLENEKFERDNPPIYL